MFYILQNEKVAEWSKAADCKSVSYSRIGSNPILFKMLSFGTRKFNSLDKSFLLKNIINNNVTCVRPKIIKINKTNKFIELLVNINKLYCLKYYNIINKLNVNYVNNRIFRKNKNKNYIIT